MNQIRLLSLLQINNLPKIKGATNVNCNECSFWRVVVILFQETDSETFLCYFVYSSYWKASGNAFAWKTTFICEYHILWKKNDVLKKPCTTCYVKLSGRFDFAKSIDENRWFCETFLYARFLMIEELFENPVAVKLKRAQKHFRKPEGWLRIAWCRTTYRLC